MTAPAAKWAPWCDMEALSLGEHIVARVHVRGTNAWAIFNLDDARHSAIWRKYSSASAAKVAMERRLADWLAKARLA